MRRLARLPYRVGFTVLMLAFGAYLVIAGVVFTLAQLYCAIDEAWRD